MGLEEKAGEREIGGTLYKVQPIPFAKGLPALARLIKLIAPVLAAVAETGGRASAAVLEQLPILFDEKELTYFSKLLAEGAWYAGPTGEWVPMAPDAQRAMHFDGRYLEFMRWLLFAVEVNFSGFFGGAMNTQGALDLLNKLNLKPSTESTRGSGSAQG